MVSGLALWMSEGFSAVHLDRMHWRVANKAYI